MNKYAEYHGDHKAYLSGDTSRKHENNQIFLNDKCVSLLITDCQYMQFLMLRRI
jgi:hypothetical protein